LKSITVILSLALLIFGGVSVADATAVNFKIGDAIPIEYDSIDLAIVSETFPFSGIPSLKVGESFTFDYGAIKSIKVIKELSTHSITAEVKAKYKKDTDKFSIVFDPENVKFDTEGLFTVKLSNLYAYPALINDGCGSGCYYHKADKGTINHRMCPVAVPEPSTFILFGTVLIGALGVKRIKR